VNDETVVANSTVDKAEAEPAIENGEKEIEEKKPEATSDNEAGSKETTGAEAEKTTETCSPGDEKMDVVDDKDGDGDKV